MKLDVRPKWPRRFPWAAFGGLLLAGVLTLCMVYVRAKVAGPVQSFYLGRYLTDPMTMTMHMPNFNGKPVDTRRDIRVAYCGGLAATADVCHGKHSTQTLKLDPVKFDTWLRNFVYGGQTRTEWLRWPLWLGGLLSIPLMIFGFRSDIKHNRQARNGTQIRGPRLVTPRDFNGEINGDGFKLWLEGNKYTDWLRRQKSKYVQIEKLQENSHIACTADPGGGKSLVAKQFLAQVRDRKETAIIYDPHREFTPIHFTESRGDRIMNPNDARCPSWSPSDEIDRSDRSRAQANALAQAECLFPGKPGDRDWFFVYCCQQIWAYLIVEYGPDAQQMAELLRHAEPLVDLMVEGTELEAMMAHNAANQRAGVIAQLTQICYALDQIPPREEGRPHMILRDYAKTRHGWLFFTNTQATRKGLRVLQSLWLDWLIMCILSEGERPDLPNTLILFDELHTLQKLNQFVSMLTEGRKSLRGMYCIQGRAQVKELYGPDLAEVLLSAPYTKFFMRTTEPDASEWQSKTVGDIEVSRVTQSRPVGTVFSANGRAAGTYTEGKVIEKLLLPSQFSGLKPRRGYMKYGDLVVPIKIPITKYEKIAEGLIERTGNPVEPRPIPTMAQLEEEMRQRAAAQREANDRARQQMASDEETRRRRNVEDTAEAVAIALQAVMPQQPRRGRPRKQRPDDSVTINATQEMLIAEGDIEDEVPTA